jgi:hypothetical protein
MTVYANRIRYDPFATVMFLFVVIRVLRSIRPQKPTMFPGRDSPGVDLISVWKKYNLFSLGYFGLGLVSEVWSIVVNQKRSKNTKSWVVRRVVFENG